MARLQQLTRSHVQHYLMERKNRLQVISLVFSCFKCANSKLFHDQRSLFAFVMNCCEEEGRWKEKPILLQSKTAVKLKKGGRIENLIHYCSASSRDINSAVFEILLVFCKTIVIVVVNLLFHVSCYFAIWCRPVCK